MGIADSLWGSPTSAGARAVLCYQAQGGIGARPRALPRWEAKEHEQKGHLNLYSGTVNFSGLTDPFPPFPINALPLRLDRRRTDRLRSASARVGSAKPAERAIA